MQLITATKLSFCLLKFVAATVSLSVKVKRRNVV